LFFKEYTEEGIKKINSNMLESQKYSNIYKNSFTLKEKILLNDNFKKEIINLACGVSLQKL